MDKYQKIEKLGEGTYGIVYKAQNKETGDVVALKRIRLDSEEDGMPCTAIREISLLKELRHANIVRLYDVVHTEKKLTLVFEHMDSDLKKYVDTVGDSIEPSAIRHITRQVLCAVQFCHAHGVLHRDIKPQNVLVSRRLDVRLGDFGLARTYGVPLSGYSREVVTLWYRAPEVLLGSRVYGPPIDMWALGCVMGEVASAGVPLFPGSSARDQVFKIFRVLGAPNSRDWPELMDMPEYEEARYSSIDTKGSGAVAQLAGKIDSDGVDLLSQMLEYNPQRRITADDALEHPYFQNHTQNDSSDSDSSDSLNVAERDNIALGINQHTIPKGSSIAAILSS